MISCELSIPDESSIGEALNSSVLLFLAETIFFKTLIEARIEEEIELQLG